ncbi:casein kinase II subunit beta [Pilobolus umbonatus]|nr:casein kinase II subunit beta [Pilobolus umbonatus]
MSDNSDERSSMEISQSLSWISWFCSTRDHKFYVEVDEKFIEDPFNLTGLNTQVPLYRETLELILDLEPADEMYNRVPDLSLLEPYAELLYGLIHQRYILTRAGMFEMLAKYEAGDFGVCPRVYCDQCHLLPCGQHDKPKLSVVRLYCPNCKDIYIPPNPKYSNIDGAYFGTSFPHLFVQTFPDVIKSVAPKIYVARLFGFRVNEQSESGPRMQWLRMVDQQTSEDR